MTTCFINNKYILLFLTIFICGNPIFAQQKASSVFEIVNLNYPGLEKAKEQFHKGDSLDAKKEIVDYFKRRFEKENGDKEINISENDKIIADNALEHKFFSMSAYPSYFYGNDIDWTYWPVHDNELRWQLHRFKWFIPLGKAYRSSGDEKYAKAWVHQLDDWINKNPYPSPGDKYVPTKKDLALNSNDLLKDGDENAQFAWRPLETSGRLITLYETFNLISPSSYVTPDFMERFFISYDLHAEHVIHNLSKEGNHLLMEAEYLIFAGCNFPELKRAELWRNKGIQIMKEQLDIQVYDDGVQYELDPGYHIGTIQSFINAYQLASDKGFSNEFPSAYMKKVERMMEFTMNLLLPDYSNPMFSDAGKSSRDYYNNLFKKWFKVFPENKHFQYFGTNGIEGVKPNYNSNAFKNGGFYIFRNGWDSLSTTMIIKAGPPARWHNQPDNGTFELFLKGRSFFSDSGRYIYGGDSIVLAQRNWFRQTRVHNTLTLNSRNIETTDSKCLLWDTTHPDYEVLVTENNSYKDLKHRRTLFFVDKTFFVIVDEAIGDEEGVININFQLGEDHVLVDNLTNTIYTDFADGNNMRLDLFTDEKCVLCKEEGWISYEYGKKKPRNSFSYNIKKNKKQTIKAISVISPISDYKLSESPVIEIIDNDLGFKSLDVSWQGKRWLLNSKQNFSE